MSLPRPVQPKVSPLHVTKRARDRHALIVVFAVIVLRLTCINRELFVCVLVISCLGYIEKFVVLKIMRRDSLVSDRVTKRVVLFHELKSLNLL